MNKSELKKHGSLQPSLGKRRDSQTLNGTKQKLHEEPQLHQPDAHNIPELWADFLDSIKTGRRPVCDIEIGYRATLMSLLAVLSQKLRRSVEWDAGKQMVVADPEANKLLSREYRSPWEYPRV